VTEVRNSDIYLSVKHFDGAQYQHFLVEHAEYDTVALKFGSHYCQIIPIVLHLKDINLDYSKQDSWNSANKILIFNAQELSDVCVNSGASWRFINT